ncbi:MAG: sulfatase family protein, partial [Bacteroidales bacterium]
KVPGGRQGVSFKKLVEKGDPNASHQPFVVTETTFLQTGGTLGWMVRTPKYKYVLYDKGKNREQFYDLEADRGEMRNLAIEAKYKPEIEKHRKMLNEWMNNHKPKNGKDYTRFIPTK